MLKLQSKQHIRFAKVDKGSAWVVVAVLIETLGNETISVSEPKVVKIIPKAQHLLPTSKNNHKIEILLLTAPAENLASHAIPTPYFTFIFSSEKSNFITGIAPQPPTLG